MIKDNNIMSILQLHNQNSDILSLKDLDDTTKLQLAMEDRPTSRRRLNLDQVADSTESDEPTHDPDDIKTMYEIKKISPSRIVMARPHYIFDNNMDLFDTDDSIENISVENELLSKVVSKEQNLTMRAWTEQRNINVRETPINLSYIKDC